MKKSYLCAFVMLLPCFAIGQTKISEQFFSVGTSYMSGFAANEKLSELGMPTLSKGGFMTGVGMHVFINKVLLTSDLFYGRKQNDDGNLKQYNGQIGMSLRYKLFDSPAKFFAGLSYRYSYVNARFRNQASQVNFNQNPFAATGNLEISNYQHMLGPSIMAEFWEGTDFAVQFEVSYLIGLSKRSWTSDGDLVIGLSPERYNAWNFKISYALMERYTGK